MNRARAAALALFLLAVARAGSEEPQRITILCDVLGAPSTLERVAPGHCKGERGFALFEKIGVGAMLAPP